MRVKERKAKKYIYNVKERVRISDNKRIQEVAWGRCEKRMEEIWWWGDFRLINTLSATRSCLNLSERYDASHQKLSQQTHAGGVHFLTPLTHVFIPPSTITFSRGNFDLEGLFVALFDFTFTEIAFTYALRTKIKQISKCIASSLSYTLILYKILTLLRTLVHAYIPFAMYVFIYCLTLVVTSVGVEWELHKRVRVYIYIFLHVWT